MRFQVPQFIEIEDKIFGPFTFKQFVYLSGGGGIVFLLYQALPLYVAVFFILPIIALSGMLAFYKINERPFILALESSVKHLLSTKLYTWKRIPKKNAEEVPPEKKQVAESIIPKLSEGKLKDIAWSLDVHESIYASEEKVVRERTVNEPKENSSFIIPGT